MRRLAHLVTWAVLLVGNLDAVGEVAAQQKAPVPGGEAQAPARTAAGDLYGDRFRVAKTCADKTALANDMLQAALQMQDGTADQYVLLDIARDVAAGAGDAQTALAVAEKLAGRFDVPDAKKLKAETLLAAGRRASTSAQRKAVAEAATGVISELAAAEDYQTAISLCESARSAAQMARQYALVKELTARSQELERHEAASKAYADAMAVLDKNPTEPAANLAAGRYLCFAKGDWARGVPMLALGSDPKLKETAIEDLKGAATTAEQAALADAWWDLAENSDGQEKESLMLRAGSWYRQAEPGLGGISRVKVQKRLEVIAKLGREIPEPLVGPTPAVAPFDEKKARQYQAVWARHLRVPVVQTNSIGMKLVLIPPGEFDMGSTEQEVAQRLEEGERQNAPGWYLGRLRAEAPRHRVKITKPLYLGQYQVTQEQYERVMGNNPSQFKGDANRPVERVSWDDAVAFCRNLSEKEGNTYRLPTEAEWEYTCRAGTHTRYSFGDDVALLERYAWWRMNSQGGAQPVGKLQPNAWGLFDMHGNVWEWCSDWFAADYYVTSPTASPPGPNSGVSRVFRGGSWSDGLPGLFRCAYRNDCNPVRLGYNHGFRVARTLTP